MNNIVRGYELVGFINLYNIIPDFVYPVFLAHNKFYFQDGESILINKFYEIPTDLTKKIVFLKDLFIEKLTPLTFPKMFYPNSPTVYVYQQNKEKFFMGDIIPFYNFIKMETHNDFIIDFLNENKFNYNLANNMNIEKWSCKLNQYSSNVKKSNNFLPTIIQSYYYPTFNNENSFFTVDEIYLKVDINKNIKLYDTFCELIDEYSDIFIDISSVNQKIEFVEKLLKKKKWLLSPEQYKIILNKYGKNYLFRKECAYRINYSDLKEENKALVLLNHFLRDVIEDKNIHTFENIYV